MDQPGQKPVPIWDTGASRQRLSVLCHGAIPRKNCGNMLASMSVLSSQNTFAHLLVSLKKIFIDCMGTVTRREQCLPSSGSLPRCLQPQMGQSEAKEEESATQLAET